MRRSQSASGAGTDLPQGETVSPSRHSCCMPFFRRRLPPIPLPPRTVDTRCEELRWSMRDGWDPDLQRVRLALPNHLHDSAPYRNGHNGLWMIIAEVDGVAVALAWSIEWLVDRNAALLEEVAVVAEWQGQGLGTRLVKETADWMRELGYVRLASKPITPGAWAMFRRLGFLDDGQGMQLASCADLADP